MLKEREGMLKELEEMKLTTEKQISVQQSDYQQRLHELAEEMVRGHVNVCASVCVYLYACWSAYLWEECPIMTRLSRSSPHSQFFTGT